MTAMIGFLIGCVFGFLCGIFAIAFAQAAKQNTITDELLDEAFKEDYERKFEQRLQELEDAKRDEELKQIFAEVTKEDVAVSTEIEDTTFVEETVETVEIEENEKKFAENAKKLFTNGRNCCIIK